MTKIMKRFFVGYAARGGQTAVIASYIASRLRARGHFVMVEDLERMPPALDPLHGCDGLVLAASLHAGRHEHEVVEFVRDNLSMIRSWPSAFISVSAAQAVAESVSASPAERTMAHLEVSGMVDRFLHETGWQPWIVKPLGGVDHAKRSLVERWAVKHLLGRHATTSDTPREHLSTQWPMVDAVADNLERQLLSCKTPEELAQVFSERVQGYRQPASFRS
jgi:menaquinone-dependent protoporphyrinogen oxidase